ncbi:MAG: TlyA family RNA methyltransferase [Calditerrivibrio sp.]|nr:TlyA family RNA methyltransferase [Calditerrivibrio sp.]
MKKVRIDNYLVEHKFCSDIDTARRLLMSGKVRHGTDIIDKPGTMVFEDIDIEIKGSNRFVSRGGLKLEKGMLTFGLDFSGKTVIDIGSSTGGFTDFALKSGAAKVYAIDVGKGILDYSLRNDKRVVVKEGINFKNIEFEEIGESVDIIVGDLSFISLKAVYPKICIFCRDFTEVCLLIKPQFEAKKEEVGKGGVVDDLFVHKRVILEVLECYMGMMSFCGLTKSPIRGAKGNIEYLVFFVYKGIEMGIIDLKSIIDKVVDEEFSYCCKTTC